jgi:hypothetical protein
MGTLAALEALAPCCGPFAVAVVPALRQREAAGAAVDVVAGGFAIERQLASLDELRLDLLPQVIHGAPRASARHPSCTRPRRSRNPGCKA